jgi:ribosome maturation factor RimP
VFFGRRILASGLQILLVFGFWQRALGPEWVRPLFFLEDKLARQEGTVERVRSVALRVTADRGFELVEVELKQAKSEKLVRIFVDRPGGIGLEDLQSVSEEVSAILDAEDPIDGHYTLEVSSPGLDRPLRGEADYRRFVGKLAKLASYEPVEGRRHWTGRIVACDDGIVTLELDGEKASARVPLAKLSHGRLEVEFPKNG